MKNDSQITILRETTSIRLKRELSAVEFYSVTTMSAWFNICYHTATRFRSFDFRFQRPGSHPFKLPNTKWQGLQSLLLSSFTSCGVSYLKVRMNNNQWKVLAILWVTFGKPNTTRFHIQTIKIRWNTTSPPGRSVFRIPQYRMNLHPNTANEYLKQLFVHLHD